MADRNVNANSILPVLGMAQQYFEKKAKKKILGDFTSGLKDRFSGISDPVELEKASQQMISDIYSNENLDPQEQATALQLGNSYRGLQQNTIAQQQAEYGAMSSIELMNEMTKDKKFSSNGKLLKGEELLTQIESKFPNLTNEQKMQMYTKTLQLGETKATSTYRADETGFYGTDYLQDKLGNSFQQGEEFKIDENSKNLSLETQQAYNKFTTGQFESDQKEDRRIAKEERTFGNRLRMQEISATNQLKKQYDLADQRQKQKLEEQYNADVKGKTVQVVDPRDPLSRIFANRRLVVDKEVPEDQRLKNYNSGLNEFAIYGDDNKIIPNAQIKTNINKLPADEKKAMLVNIGDQFGNWYKKSGTGWSNLDSPLMDWVYEHERGLYEILKDPGDKTTGKALVDQLQISQPKFEEMARAFNAMETKDERDIEFMRNIENLYGNFLIKRNEDGTIKTGKNQSDALEEKQSYINEMKN